VYFSHKRITRAFVGATFGKIVHDGIAADPAAEAARFEFSKKWEAGANCDVGSRVRLPCDRRQRNVLPRVQQGVWHDAPKTSLQVSKHSIRRDLIRLLVVEDVAKCFVIVVLETKQWYRTH
jgi:hypothetical protein